jgi:hypothetical protein
MKAPTRITPLHRPGEGHYAEVFNRKGLLIHTTAIYADRTAAIEAAKRWLQEQKKASVS